MAKAYSFTPDSSAGFDAEGEADDSTGAALAVGASLGVGAGAGSEPPEQEASARLRVSAGSRKIDLRKIVPPLIISGALANKW